MSESMNPRSRIRLQMLFLTVYAAVLTALHIQTVTGTYITTMYAFTYNHGFLARGVMGTLLLVIDRILPGVQYSYEGVRAMCYAQDVLFVGLLLFFMYYCLKHTDAHQNWAVFLLAFFLGTLSFPEFIAFQNFGRTDAVCACLVLVMVFLVILRRAEWLCIPLCALGVMIHQGFVLQFISVPLALLFYRMMVCFTEGKEGRLNLKNKEGQKFFWMAALCVAAAGVLFLYLNFNHSAGIAAYETVLATAKRLAAPQYNGEIHEQLLMHEILGQDPATDEHALHMFNFRESAVYLVLVSPYLWIAVRFFIDVMKKARGAVRRFTYGVWIAAAWLILPDFLIKIDFGRWVYAVIFYYFVTVLALLVQKDAVITEAFQTSAQRIAKHRIVPWLLALYGLVFSPMGDIWISRLSMAITNVIFGPI